MYVVPSLNEIETFYDYIMLILGYLTKSNFKMYHENVVNQPSHETNRAILMPIMCSSWLINSESSSIFKIP